MAKIDTSDIDKTPFISEYKRIYGEGNEAKMYFAFRLIQIAFATMCVSIILVFVGCFLISKYTEMNVEFMSVLGIVVPFFSAPLTFMLGSLYGKPIDKK